jgi:hypothetical protein
MAVGGWLVGIVGNSNQPVSGLTLSALIVAALVMVGIGGGRERSQLVRTYCTLRGRFRLGPARLYAGDPFGLFPVSRAIPQTHQLVVLPLVSPLPSFPLPSGRLKRSRHDLHQIAQYAGVCEYAPATLQPSTDVDRRPPAIVRGETIPGRRVVLTRAAPPDGSFPGGTGTREPVPAVDLCAVDDRIRRRAQHPSFITSCARSVGGFRLRPPRHSIQPSGCPAAHPHLETLVARRRWRTGVETCCASDCAPDARSDDPGRFGVDQSMSVTLAGCACARSRRLVLMAPVHLAPDANDHLAQGGRRDPLRLIRCGIRGGLTRWRHPQTFGRQL